MWPFKNKKLDQVLYKTIKASGIKFKIKKLDPVAYLDGSKVMLQYYDVYKLKTEKEDLAIDDALLKKIKEHYKDVFLYSVVSPKLKRNNDDKEGQYVDDLFDDWELCNSLYEAIVVHTYGKKKLRQNTSLKKN